MAIRQHLRRAFRSDISIIEITIPSKITTTTKKSSQTSDNSTSSKPLANDKPTSAWTWTSNSEIKERKPKRKNKKTTHPSEKPLTAQNLEHQEMLSHFTFTFGASRPEQIEGHNFAGISPCCTRAPSIADFSSDSDALDSSSSSVKSS